MLQNTTVPLLAAGIGDLLSGIIPLIVLVLWVIRQIVEANKQAAPARGKGPVVPPQPAGPEGAPAGQQADPLRSQVEEFLRRAGKLEPEEKRPQRPRAAVVGDVEVLIGENAEPRRRPLAEPLRPITPMPTAGQSFGAAPPEVPRPEKPAPRRAVGRRRPSVAEHVAEHVGSRSQSLTRQASSLGRRIIEEDRQFDSQIKAKFDHAVGTLAGSRPEAVELTPVPPTSPAAQIAAMLTNPEGIQQVIIANEILRRPSERW
jgi:hypothetical protein